MATKMQKLADETLDPTAAPVDPPAFVETFDGIAHDLLVFIDGPNGTSAGIDHAVTLAKQRLTAMRAAQ